MVRNMVGRTVQKTRVANLSKKQMVERFLQAIAEGQSFEQSGRSAGMANVETAIAREIHNPEFLPAMTMALRHRLAGRLSVKAMNVTEELLSDKQTSPRIRWDIAKTVLAAGVGFIAPKARELEAPPTDISTMNAQELLDFSERVNREMVLRADAAKLIEHDPQVLDSLD